MDQRPTPTHNVKVNRRRRWGQRRVAAVFVPTPSGRLPARPGAEDRDGKVSEHIRRCLFETFAPAVTWHLPSRSRWRWSGRNRGCVPPATVLSDQACARRTGRHCGGGAQTQQRSQRIRRWDHHVTLGFENPSRKLVDGDVIVDDHDDRGGGARQQGAGSGDRALQIVEIPRSAGRLSVFVTQRFGARLYEGEISPSSIEGISREHQRSIIRHDAIATAS